MDDGMGATAPQELTPILCLCALYEVAKTAPLPFEGHARVEACFRRAHRALEDAQNAKPKPKKKAAPSRRARKKATRK